MDKYTREKLEPAVAASYSFSDVARYFGVKLHGGSQHHIKTRIEKFGIPTPHFRWSEGRAFRNRRLAPEEILVRRKPGSYRQHGYLLKRALLERGVEEKCAVCGLDTEWKGKALVLVVDHINGDPMNCLEKNLRLLCPNCDSQTPTYKGRNSGRATR